MDLKIKIEQALATELEAEYLRLNDEGGISGFVVSPQFKRMPTLERQEWIDDILHDKLTDEESQQVLMIAALTPEEYESVGTRVRVRKIKEKGPGELEIVLHGIASDAAYVRGALGNEKGIKTSEPERVAGVITGMMSFRAWGSKANPLTKAKAIEALKKDRYIEVVADA